MTTAAGLGSKDRHRLECGIRRGGMVAFAVVASLTAVFASAGWSQAADVYVGQGRGGLVRAEPSRMIEAAQTRGEIPVIVEMNLDFTAEGKLSLFEAANQRYAITDAQERILGRISGARNVKTYESVPMMAMTVGANELATLLDDWSVTAVYEDVPVPPVLDDSVPLIRADKTSKIRRVNGGKGWAVAVLDTGVQRNHKALRGKIVSEACYSTRDTSYNSYSVCPGGKASSTARGSGANCSSRVEGCDHGTHVSGIAVGNPGGANRKYKGVARKANLIPIQVFSKFKGATYCGSSSPCALSFTSDQLSALERVNTLAKTHKIASVNMSIGGGLYSSYCDSPLKKIIKTLRSKRIAVAIAAGNDYADGQVSSPGCVRAAVTVASTTKSDDVSSFSNFAKMVDLVAPGSDIRSSILNNRFGVKSGTSMATPHVAGAWALLRKRYPTASVAKIERALKCSGVAVSRSGLTKKRIDVYGAYKAVNKGC